jgi:hypothetical protein
MIQHKTPPKNYRTICSGEPDFAFIDGVMLIRRAAIEISDRCPEELKMAIIRGFASGHVKMVANIPEREYLWEKLQS